MKDTKERYRWEGFLIAIRFKPRRFISAFLHLQLDIYHEEVLDTRIRVRITHDVISIL